MPHAIRKSLRRSGSGRDTTEKARPIRKGTAAPIAALPKAPTVPSNSHGECRRAWEITQRTGPRRSVGPVEGRTNSERSSVMVAIHSPRWDFFSTHGTLLSSTGLCPACTSLRPDTTETLKTASTAPERPCHHHARVSSQRETDPKHDPGYPVDPQPRHEPGFALRDAGSECTECSATPAERRVHNDQYQSHSKEELMLFRVNGHAAPLEIRE